MTDARHIEQTERQQVAFNQEIAPFSQNAESGSTARILPNVGEVIFQTREASPSAFVPDPRLVTAIIRLLKTADPARWLNRLLLVAYKPGPDHTASDARYSVPALGPDRTLEFTAFSPKKPSAVSSTSAVPRLKTDITPMRNEIPNPAVRDHFQALHKAESADMPSPFLEDVEKIQQWRFKFIDMQNPQQIA